MYMSQLGRLGMYGFFLNHACTHGCVRQRINQNETTRGPIAFVWIKKNCATCFELDGRNLVHFELLCGMLAKIVNVNPAPNTLRFDPHLMRVVFEKVSAIQLE